SLTPGEKRLILEVDGELMDVVVTGQTVREALEEWGIRLRAGDRVFPPPDALVVDGSYVTYTRRFSVPAGKPVALPYGTAFEPDPSLPVGARRLQTDGTKSPGTCPTGSSPSVPAAPHPPEDTGRGGPS
ncbi:MAG: ubiquitin-like domain-containing protein, partial [Armatimonadota bacterium]